MSSFTNVHISNERFAEAERFLTQLPFEMRTDVVGAALRAAIRPVKEWAKVLAPDSYKSGSRDLWSKKVEAQRAGKPQLSETIVTKMRSYRTLDIIVVGPSWPSGNIVNVIGHPHRRTFWGRFSQTRQMPANKFLWQASEITKAEQGQNFTNTIVRRTNRFLRRVARGRAA